jgi:branched-chain amino acid transport system permease protein
MIPDSIASARRAIREATDPAFSATRRTMAIPQVRASLLVLLVVGLFLYPLIEIQTKLDLAVSTQVLILLALGLNIVVGFAGLLDLGYAAFFAIGAYTLALLSSPQFAIAHHSFSSPLVNWGPGGIYVNFYLMIPLAAMVAATSGVLFGFPTLRLRGDYLAIVTLGFGEVVPLTIRNLGPDNSLGLPNITNGVNRITGLQGPPDIHSGPVDLVFSGNSNTPWYYLGLIICILSVIAIYSLRNSRLGRAWAAIREDEIAAAHMGINIRNTRLLAFALGAAFSGFGGLLEGARITSVDSSQFDFSVSIKILVMVILGGMGSIPGAIIGAFILNYLDLSWLTLINEKIHDLGAAWQGHFWPIGAIGDWMFHLDLISARPLIFGIILVSVMLLRPQGIWPSTTRARELKPETEEVLEEENADLYTVRAE